MTDTALTSLKNNDVIHQKNANISNKHVLIIDDISEMRIMLKSFMMSLGYSNIDVESSGQFAIKQILEKPYDIVLSDYNLNGSIDGQQILETVRENSAHAYSTIFIMVTADTAYESVVNVLEYQPDSYIVKPFSPAEFFRRFEQVQKQKKTFENINAARKIKDYELMETLAKAVLAQHPQFTSQCLKIIGESLYARKRYKDAKIHYMLIIQKNKNLAWAHFGVASCELKLGTIAAAIKKLEDTIRSSRHFLSAYDLLADSQEKLGDLKAAQTAMIKVIQVSPRAIDRSVRLAQISMSMKDWVMAEYTYSRIIRLTHETIFEKIEYYYDCLKCITHLMESAEDSVKLAEKFKRILMRLRIFGKENPSAISNSFRLEIQQYLIRNHKEAAIKSWKQWNQLINSSKASPLTDAQAYTLEKRLGLK
ncbi:chemotaxis protein CheY [Marinomonas ushuaiensis DSM 15871]|uniref:Chemotaxis protein CheY n=1 Tax=Marinomonas ushuaiensis DSM 15871 TaxID=1122207 RepID=X7E7Z8_9GAMM|nr:response regulator [Marinomonas ushuaiensis]ETX11306.1 chemotaxis protein CheY [Marinomonas ushuaiensis DSM 15871]